MRQEEEEEDEEEEEEEEEDGTGAMQDQKQKRITSTSSSRSPFLTPSSTFQGPSVSHAFVLRLPTLSSSFNILPLSLPLSRRQFHLPKGVLPSSLA